jgi:hypothetical protein
VIRKQRNPKNSLRESSIIPRWPSLAYQLYKYRETLREILLLRKYSKQQAQSGIDLLKLNKGEEKKQKKKKKVDAAQPEEDAEDFGLKESGNKAAADEEDEP